MNKTIWKILFSLFLLLSFCLWMQTFASVVGLEKKVFEIRVYEYDDVANMYSRTAAWSAVLVDDDKVVTNAHVIMDYDENIVGNYEICKTVSFDKEPECFSVLKLLSYNVDDDLALLEIMSPKSLPEPITKSTKKLSMWDSVKIYGYPANGWNTITFTEGKISGYMEWFYKVDANMDAGNSGWWAFDEDGGLIGISAAVSVGYTTLGLVIPMDKVNDFLANKGVTKHGKTPNLSFANYIMSKNSILKSDSIDDNYMSISSLKKYGFKIYEAYFTSNKDITEYILESKDEDDESLILINTHQEYSNGNFKGMEDWDFEQMLKDQKKELKKQWIKFNYKTFEYKGHSITLTATVDKDWEIYLSMISDNMNWVVMTDMNWMKTIKNALLMYLKATTIKDVEVNEAEYYNLWFLKVPLDSVMAREMLYLGEKQISMMIDVDSSLLLKVNYNGPKFTKMTDMTYSEFLEYTASLINSSEWAKVNDLWLKKTDNWFYYNAMDLERDGVRYIDYNFFVLKWEESGYYEFEFEVNSREDVVKIEALMNKIVVDGEQPFEKVWTTGKLELDIDVDENFEEMLNIKDSEITDCEDERDLAVVEE